MCPASQRLCSSDIGAADRETLIYEATLDSIRVLVGTANEAAVSVWDRLALLFGDPDLDARWLRHALYGLMLQGCEEASNGELPRHTVAALIIRTFERGICELD
jgi:hypothetical protein